jgi:hypothetical protein
MNTAENKNVALYTAVAVSLLFAGEMSFQGSLQSPCRLNQVRHMGK